MRPYAFNSEHMNSEYELSVSRISISFAMTAKDIRSVTYNDEGGNHSSKTKGFIKQLAVGFMDNLLISPRPSVKNHHLND